MIKLLCLEVDRMKPVIFIDGEFSTSGLQIYSKLKDRSDIELLRLPERECKSPKIRAAAINACDIVVLCLPGEASRQAISFIKNPSIRILDASSTHSIMPDWVYGFPELASNQTQKIATAKCVSNPGCYSIGAVALLSPLIEAKILSTDYPINIHAVSGFAENREHVDVPFDRYGLMRFGDTYVSEMRAHARLRFDPIFTPAYGNFRQGIVLYIPLHQRLLPPDISAETLHARLTEHYAEAECFKVLPMDTARAISYLEPEYLNGTNNIDLYVFSCEKTGHIILATIYDSWGKGAAGTTIQNLDIMLNLEKSLPP
jgi:N-acetyl-gamma-glutamyl-phosphate reductase